MSKSSVVLVIEDDNVKWTDVQTLLNELLPSAETVRVASVRDADEFFDRSQADFVVLDMSMNISPDSEGASRAAHANLGGLEIVERLWLLGIEVPTVVLTGFDYFRAPGKRQHAPEAYNLADLELKLKEFLGTKLVACIKYGSAGWKDEFKNAIKTIMVTP